MRFRNVLIVVSDMKKSIEFYRELFGLHVVTDYDGNVILSEGIVLQDRRIWEKFIEKPVISESNSCELYFEEKNIEAFVDKLNKYKDPIKYVNKLMTHDWGQKVVRFYDPDGNLIEVGSSFEQKK